MQIWIPIERLGRDERSSLLRTFCGNDFFHLIVGSVVKNRVEGEGLSKSTDVNTATVGQQQVDDVCGKKV
jgi:hypothetical protein